MKGDETIASINMEYRRKDESHKWPINGKFNVTERAIRQVRTLAQAMGGIHNMYEYRALLDQHIAAIVNDESNW